jgi:hypothetical protein
MDLLALYQPRGYVPLDDLAQLCGFPGKLGMDGSKVGEAFRAGKIEEIRNYCETDVANTHLVFLRFQLLRGIHDAAIYKRECDLVRGTLENQDLIGANFATLGKPEELAVRGMTAEDSQPNPQEGEVSRTSKAKRFHRRALPAVVEYVPIAGSPATNWPSF